MSSGVDRFRPNSPPVVYETIAGETILVHLETGNYYDLNASGGFIFGLFADPSTLEEAAAATVAHYGLERTEAEAAVEGFASELVAEGLLRVDDGGGAPATPAPEPPAAEWQPPTLAKHTDMQELVMLDPVHEVDAAGWPARA